MFLSSPSFCLSHALVDTRNRRVPPCAVKTCAVRPVFCTGSETKVEAGAGAAPRARKAGQSAQAESTQPRGSLPRRNMMRKRSRLQKIEAIEGRNAHSSREREGGVGATQTGRGWQTLTRRPPTENKFRPPSPRCVSPCPPTPNPISPFKVPSKFPEFPSGDLRNSFWRVSKHALEGLLFGTFCTTSLVPPSPFAGLHFECSSPCNFTCPTTR